MRLSHRRRARLQWEPQVVAVVEIIMVQHEEGLAVIQPLVRRMWYCRRLPLGLVQYAARRRRASGASSPDQALVHQLAEVLRRSCTL